jgi:hypothetical protein
MNSWSVVSRALHLQGFEANPSIGFSDDRIRFSTKHSVKVGFLENVAT